MLALCMLKRFCFLLLVFKLHEKQKTSFDHNGVDMIAIISTCLWSGVKDALEKILFQVLSRFKR